MASRVRGGAKAPPQAAPGRSQATPARRGRLSQECGGWVPRSGGVREATPIPQAVLVPPRQSAHPGAPVAWRGWHLRPLGDPAGRQRPGTRSPRVG